MTTQARRLGGRPHGDALCILARARPAPLQALAEALLDILPAVEVVENRTGLVMLPMIDTVQGAAFHLGEALLSEARVRHCQVAAIGSLSPRGSSFRPSTRRHSRPKGRRGGNTS